MLVVRGTKKLRDRLKRPNAGPGDTSTTALGDWFANALFWRPQVVLLVNARTLLPVFMPLAPAATVLGRIPEAIASVLRRHGAAEAFVTAELAAMAELRIAPTNDRRVLGVMNELATHGELVHQRHRIDDLEEISVRVSRLLVGPLLGGAGSPDRELAAVLGIDRSNVIQLPLTPAADTGTERTASVYQLKVTVVGTKPPIWRRVLVDGSATLDELHEVIQAAFGWWNYHLYEFQVGRTRYRIPDPDDDFGPPPHDARRRRLDSVAEPGTSFTYTYDFGDDWQHKVTVEKVLDESPTETLPACVDGRRAGPPEDCGGVWGYAELLEILADPDHPEHAERTEWVEGWGRGPFDPDRFDPAEFAEHLESLHHDAFDD